MPIENFHRFLMENKNLLALNEEDDEDNSERDGTYASCVVETIAAINLMLGALAPSDPDVVDQYVARKKDLSEGLEPTVVSHLKMWKSLDSMAGDLQNAIIKSKQWEEEEVKSDDQIEKLDALAKRYKEGDISKEDYLKEIKNLQSVTSGQQGRNIFFERTKSAFKYFREAVRAFATCGVNIIKGKKESELSWLDNATEAASKNLSKK